MPDRRRRRAGAARRRARDRAGYLSRRIGTGLRDARLSIGWRQRDAGERAGVSQPFWSRLERGLAPSISLETLCACAAALDLQLAAFVEAAPGASLPRDIEHLRRQRLVVEVATPGGWTATPEAGIHADGPRPRSIDVLLTRAARHEAAVVEVWDLLDDVGEAMRSLEAKVAATSLRLGADWRVQGLLLLRRTLRNRRLVRDFAALIAARYPASSAAWLTALSDPSRPMPRHEGFAWTSVRGDRLIAARLR